MSSLLPHTNQGAVDLNVNVSKLFRILYISTLLSITTLFMNLSIEDVNGELLLVSQFTLHALTKKGNRPSFIKSAPWPKAEKLYSDTIAYAKALLMEKVQTGVFGAMMDISLCNSGPVTIILDSKNKA